MGKRKRDENDGIVEKLKEIQAQLSKRQAPRRRRIRLISSEDETSNSSNEENTTNNLHTSMTIDDQAGPSTSSAIPTARQTSQGISNTLPVPIENVNTGQSTSLEEQREIELDEDILKLLGDAPKTDICFGTNIHKDIASRWQDILTKGLPKDIKDKVLKEHLVPANCELLVPPVLNAEVKAALPDSLVKRDAFLVERQKQIGIALAALAYATDMFIKKGDHSDILKAISDAGRILCDVHFNETKSRRSFIISATNTNMKDTLMDTKRDQFLFGENVSDILKSAKNVQRSGADLKKFQRNTNPKFNKSNFYKKTLNTRGPQRKTSSKPDVGRPRVPVAAAATTTSRNTNKFSSFRKRSPPPPPPRQANRRY